MNANDTTRTGFVASIIIRRIAPTDGADSSASTPS